MREISLQFVKYGIVGFSNTCIAYAVYALLVYLRCHYLLANAIGFCVSILNAYYWNNKYVFKKSEGQSRNAVQTLAKMFFTYGFSELILTSILLYILIDVAHVSEYLAQLLRLIVTVPFTFILNKFWSFKTKSQIKQ